MNDALATALVKAQTMLPEAIKRTKTARIPTKSGGSYSYQYASLDDLVSATRPILNECGIAITQHPSLSGDRFCLRTVLTHVSGEQFDSIMWIPNPGGTMQELGAAITYARRYAWAAALGIASEEDDDATSLEGKPSAGQAGTVAAEPKGNQPSPSDSQFVAPQAKEPPTDGGDAGSVLCTFGKHKGKHLRDVPREYLEWWVKQDEPKTAELRRQRVAAEILLKAAP